MRVELKHVVHMPNDLQPGTLYVSLEFQTAQHLCACGCGSKVRTPLGPAEWQLEETVRGPTLRPSIGNWQRPCRSHYWIWQGNVEWSGNWSDLQVAAGRARDHRRLVQHLERSNGAKKSPGVWQQLRRLFGLHK